MSSMNLKIQTNLPLVGFIIISLLLLASYLPVLATPYGAGLYGACNYNNCTISISTSTVVDLPLTGDPTGVYTIQADSVTVTTQSSDGFDVVLESDSATETSLENGANTIATSAGTPASPQVLALNTWGWRVDGQASFGAGPTTPVVDASSSSVTFAGLTENGNPTQIYESNVAAPSGDTFSVWYGVHADSTKPAGTYTRTVLYTATTAL